MRQAARIASRVIEGRAVVIVIDTQTLHTLDEVGTFIWSTLGDDHRALDDVIDAVVAEFDVERSVAAADVTAFMMELDELGALEIES